MSALFHTVRIACFAALVLPTGAVGAEPMGTVTATIAGKPYQGQTIALRSEGMATATVRAIGPATIFSIQALDTRSGRATKNNLVVEWTLMGQDTSSGLIDLSVSYWPDGMNAPFYISEGADADLNLTLERLDLGDAPQVSGSFSASMCRKDIFFAEPDTADCLPVEGRFQTALQAQH